MNDVEKLKEENKALVQALTHKFDLISSSAHELRTSLTALHWILEMLKKGDYGTLSLPQQQALGKVCASTTDMLRNVTTLLALNHTENISDELVFTPVNITTLVEHVIAEFSGEAHHKGITILMTKETTEIPVISGNADMLHVVCAGLIENALKYSDEGGTVSVALGYDSSSHTISVRVHNKGLSIPEADLPHVFDKFFRTQEVRDKNITGSGLGLFIAHDIIQRHQGTLSVASTPQIGTTFTVVLPVGQTS